jgi:hypothetical protein
MDSPTSGGRVPRRGGFDALNCRSNGLPAALGVGLDVAQVFVKPKLRLTTQDGETQVTEFEDVTLEAGESHVFGEYADAALTDVVPEVSAL